MPVVWLSFLGHQSGPGMVLGNQSPFLVYAFSPQAVVFPENVKEKCENVGKKCEINVKMY
jgi:hypothetical protein